MTNEAPTMTGEAAVESRYSGAAQQREAELCCPVDYDPKYLEAIPAEVIERDYGCGDPSRYVRPGETVLDLGSGGGKICFIASQVVGPEGRVVGVDMNDEMLELARRSAPVVAERVGYENTMFLKGRIQDLRLDRDRVDAFVRENPVTSEGDLRRLERFMHVERERRPMIADESVDVVVSNCVLNLVDPGDREQLFREIHRVLRRGGRAVISDIVADEPVPEHLRRDPELWSGCVSGAHEEEAFLGAFEAAGFYGIAVEKYEERPWRVIEGIEFRSVTVIAYKGKEGACFDHKEAVIYRGPFLSVTDDDGHVFRRGQRVAVCRKTFQLLTREPYGEAFVPVRPLHEIGEDEARPFPCGGGVLKRHPRETKGEDYDLTTEASDNCCGPECC